MQIWAQYFNIGFIKIRLIISDRDHQIRMRFLTQQFKMLFLTQHVELASHGCVQQEIALVKQNSHCYQNARGTRDHTCQNKEIVLLRVRDETRDRTCQNRKSYFSKHAVRHEIARVRTQETVLLRVRGETRNRTCQGWISYFSEYAVRHELTRARTQFVLLPEYADNTICTCQRSTV